MMTFIEDLGASIIRLFEYIGGVVLLFVETLFWILKLDVRLKLTTQQMAILGVNSILIVIITTGFAGMVISLQLAGLAVRYGVGRFVGGGVGIAMAREFAPMLTAIVVAGRAGSAITAEIASMKVTEQIDALDAMATSPVKYLVVPRFLACLAMVPILTLFANISGVCGGCLVANIQANITPKMFFDSIRNMVYMSDFWGGIEKSLIFAAEIAMIGCYQGLTTKGGAAGVGISTTGSVVFSMIIIFISNYFLSAWLFPPIAP
jgi:phospholipid/cholesterol/gamma-HCH transport system permease protein